MWTTAFWKDLVERLVWTFVEAFLGVVIAVQVADLDVAVLESAAAAGVAAVLSALKSVAAAQIKKAGGKTEPERTAQLGTTTYTYA